jgi:hypothetical protein
MIVCIKFLGNLAELLGSEACLELNNCPSIAEVMWSLIKDKNVPVVPEHLIFLSGGKSVSPEDSVCRFNELYVIRTLQGG